MPEPKTQRHERSTERRVLAAERQAFSELANKASTLMLHRRLAREYDYRPANAPSRIYWASTANLAAASPRLHPAWRDDFVAAA